MLVNRVTCDWRRLLADQTEDLSKLLRAAAFKG
jgi:hypothetical protein